MIRGASFNVDCREFAQKYFIECLNHHANISQSNECKINRDEIFSSQFEFCDNLRVCVKMEIMHIWLKIVRTILHLMLIRELVRNHCESFGLKKFFLCRMCFRCVRVKNFMLHLIFKNSYGFKRKKKKEKWNWADRTSKCYRVMRMRKFYALGTFWFQVGLMTPS